MFYLIVLVAIFVLFYLTYLAYLFILDKLNDRNGNLRFYNKLKKSRSYSEITYPYRTTVRSHLRNISKGKNRFLYIESYYRGLHIPFIDLDDEESMIKASFWLKENKTNYSIVSSSEGKYWIFVDTKCKSFDESLRWMKCVPGADKEFLSCTDHINKTLIRADMKEIYYIPTIIEESGSELLDEFINKIIQHLSSKEVKWIHRLDTYHAEGSIDFGSFEPEELDFTFADIISE